jgi:DNA-binding transcriptional ArsR family regulator
MAETTTQPTSHGPVALDKKLVAALSHPLRVRILEVLHDRVSSPRDIAEELGAKVGDVSYHVTKLRELGAIELVRTEPRRGTLKHFYRATTRAWVDDEAMKFVPPAVRRELFGDALRDFWTRVRTAAERGGFDRDDAHVSSTGLDLDDQGYAEVVTELNESLERIIAIQSRVYDRRTAGESPEQGIRTEVMLLHYERPRAPGDSD